MRTTMSRPFLVAALLGALVSTLLSSGSVASATSSREKLHKRIFDVPYYPSHPKKKVKVLDLVFQKIEMDPFTPGRNWFYDKAIAGQKGIHVYRLMYRTNYFPWKRHQEGDVYASVSMADVVFHDGFGWKGILGPFTSDIGDATRHFPCFSKLLFLPDSPEFQPGQKVSMWLNFSRTKQRIHRTTTILGGGETGGIGSPAVKIAQNMGCKNLDGGGFPAAVGDPSFVSPAGP